ncbi:hypothetical protein PMAYCL1PPCAC_20706, partial [Pristionchus mayeri]
MQLQQSNQLQKSAVHDRFNEINNNVIKQKVLNTGLRNIKFDDMDPSQIIVTNVPWEASPSEVESLFSSFNGFIKFDMPMNKYSIHCGIGFARFIANREAARAFRSIVKPIHVHR